VKTLALTLTIFFGILSSAGAIAQTAPSPAEIDGYSGLHRAAALNEAGIIRQLLKQGADIDTRDGHGRTALMVAAYLRHYDMARALIDAGADVNALDADRYDVITIAAVADDPEILRIVLEAGGDPTLVTSPYDGTTLIAAAHLGHDEVVRILIEAGAPLDHVNNLAWTALIESIVLGDGGPRHVRSLQAIVEGGADVNLADGRGVRPLTLARQRGYDEMVQILESHGARP